MNYEDEIRKRREENRELLKALGILNLHSKCLGSSKKRTIKVEDPAPLTISLRNVTNSKQTLKTFDSSMTSRDLLKKFPIYYFHVQETKLFYRAIRNGEFGAIPGVPVGTLFSTITKAVSTGVHRDRLSVIHGVLSVGCYSLILSGTSLSVKDFGESFFCAEEDGRHWKSKMKFSKVLTENMKHNHPIRVLRGPFLKSKYAPEWGVGYRYDGLYKVAEHSKKSFGSSQSKVFGFHFERIKDQEPAPWHEDFIRLEESDNSLSEKENVPNEDQLHNGNPSRSEFRILEKKENFKEKSLT